MKAVFKSVIPIAICTYDVIKKKGKILTDNDISQMAYNHSETKHVNNIVDEDNKQINRIPTGVIKNFSIVP